MTRSTDRTSAEPDTQRASAPHAPWSGTLPFRRFREPFFPEFFQRAAAAIGLTGEESLIDLGCGTGRVAFGFSPYTRRLVGVDAESPMLERGREEAARQGIAVRFVHSPIEHFEAGETSFDCATLGNIHWWLDRAQTHRVLDNVLGNAGKVFICVALPLYDEQTTPWLSTFLELRRQSNPFDYGRTRLQPEEFMRGSAFEAEAAVSYAAASRLPVEHMVRRAFGYHPTSPLSLGKGVDRFADDLRRALEPFADADGMLPDKCYNAGLVFRRRRQHAPG